MATYQQTGELTGTLIPANATGITDTGWGVTATLSGFIIQDANVTCSRSTDVTQDQKGAVIGELDYDQRWDLSLTVIGNNSDEMGEILPVGDAAFTWNGKKWKIDSVTYQGNFQSKKVWSVNCHRFTNWPNQ